MLKQTARVAGSLAVAIVLASCGGGGDIAGDSTDFSVSPDEAKLTVVSATGSCASAVDADPTVFTIIGGQAPFRIVNANPGGVIVDKTEATGKDPKFTVRPAGQCGDPFVITVLDYHSRAATVEFTVEAEKPDE
jgi:hypothetical protein